MGHRRGFTLIEVMLTVTIVAMLASIAVFSHRNSTRKAKESVLRHNLAELRLVLDHYNNDKGHYPESLDILKDEGYLREIPVDPMTNANDTWQLEFETDLADEDSDYEAGIFDVRSGSNETAIDGTLYSEW